MNVYLSKLLLCTALAGVLLFVVSGCGGDSGKITVKSGPTVSIQVTPMATVEVPSGPIPTRAADFASLCKKTDQKRWDKMPSMIIDPHLSYSAVIQTEKGDITLKLLPDIAPWTVNNFVFLACSGFYDGLTFHQVMLKPLPQGLPHPFVQAGDPSGSSLADPVEGGPGYGIPTEISEHKVLNGTVAMASRGPGSPTSGSQFFIALEDAPEWDGKFTVFGEVVSGLDVLQRLTPRNPQQHGPPGDKILGVSITESPSP